METVKHKYNLFLDDERTPLDCLSYINNNIYLTEEWEIVRNYGNFVSHILKYGLPKIISFDHDLADIHYKKCVNVSNINYDELSEKTGYDCAKWLVQYCIDSGNIELPICYVHSMNRIGGGNIMSLLYNYSKHRND
jgi:hypothetical protein